MAYVLAILDEGAPHSWCEGGKNYMRCVMDSEGNVTVTPIERPENASQFETLEQAKYVAQVLKEVIDLDVFPVPRMRWSDADK